MSLRLARVNELIKREIGNFLRRGIVQKVFVGPLLEWMFLQTYEMVQ